MPLPTSRRRTRWVLTCLLVLLGLSCDAFRRSSTHEARLTASSSPGRSSESRGIGRWIKGRKTRGRYANIGSWGESPLRAEMDKMDAGSGSGSGSSRREFLRMALGVGTGAMAALSSDTQPTHALLEDWRKPGKCPKYEAVSNFDVDKYTGIWYELAYHDWTQIEFCGCTRFNMTRVGNEIRDAFTTKCPYEYEQAETFVINMREAVNDATPGSFDEYAFYQTWKNKVVALWRSIDSTGVERYERAIQMQCVEILGRRAFVGINFLSRLPIVSPAMLAEMFEKARALGLAAIGGNPAEMVLVPHAGCRYPAEMGNSLKNERLSWGSGWGVNKLIL